MGINVKTAEIRLSEINLLSFFLFPLRIGLAVGDADFHLEEGELFCTVTLFIFKRQAGVDARPEIEENGHVAP